jgi:hypothetical protein
VYTSKNRGKKSSKNNKEELPQGKRRSPIPFRNRNFKADGESKIYWYF